MKCDFHAALPFLFFFFFLTTFRRKYRNQSLALFHLLLAFLDYLHFGVLGVAVGGTFVLWAFNSNR